MNCHREQLGELILLGVIALAVSALAAFAIFRASAGESAAWSAILMAIVNAIKERMQSRTVDRMGDQLATSTPRGSGPTVAEEVSVTGDKVTVQESEA